MTPFSIEGASSESRAVHPGSCRCTGHPSRHWPYSSACKPCARLSGLPMGLKCSRPGANSSCPTLRCRTSIRMCRSERQATPKTTTSSSKKSAEPRPGLCPLLSLHPPPAPEPAKNAASPATKRGFSSSLTTGAGTGGHLAPGGGSRGGLAAGAGASRALDHLRIGRSGHGVLRTGHGVGRPHRALGSAPLKGARGLPLECWE